MLFKARVVAGYKEIPAEKYKGWYIHKTLGGTDDWVVSHWQGLRILECRTRQQARECVTRLTNKVKATHPDFSWQFNEDDRQALVTLSPYVRDVKLWVSQQNEGWQVKVNEAKAKAKAKARGKSKVPCTLLEYADFLLKTIETYFKAHVDDDPAFLVRIVRKFNWVVTAQDLLSATADFIDAVTTQDEVAVLSTVSWLQHLNHCTGDLLLDYGKRVIDNMDWAEHLPDDVDPIESIEKLRQDISEQGLGVFPKLDEQLQQLFRDFDPYDYDFERWQGYVTRLEEYEQYLSDYENYLVGF